MGDSLFGTPGGPCIGSGIDWHGNLLEGVTLFPNPVEDVLYIRAPAGQPCFLEVYDMTGRKQHAVKLEDGLNAINLPEAMQGLKIFRIVQTMTGHSYSETLIVRP
jgi:hypothetical protein